MSINGNGDTLTITGAKLKVSGGVQVSGSIAYTDDATGFGGVTAQIDGETLNITAGKTSGVAKIERGTSANITGINHANVSNNTTIHIALKNTSSIKGNFVTIETFEDDDDVKVNYTDEYVIGPGETGMLTLRKVNGVLSLFIREMFSSTATDTDTKPFYIKDGTNYKYPLYKFSGGNLDITPVAINGVSYYQPSGGYTTKSRPPLGIPELIVSPSGNLAIGNNGDFSTINYDVWGVPASFDFGNIYQGTTKKASFLLENGEASGSFTESGASSGDAYSLYVERTDLSTSDTVTFDESAFIGTTAFHHDTFANSGDPYGDGTLAGATANAHVFADTQTGTYSWGTLTGNTLTSTNTTYTWTPTADIYTDVLVVAGGGGGGFAHGSGGGGGGGFREFSNLRFTYSNQTIIVGSGGIAPTSRGENGGNGNNSSVLSYISTGGGGGGSYNIRNGNSGGSGGGASTGPSGGGTGGLGNTPPVTPSQGNNGANRSDGSNTGGSGGGGAGSVGIETTNDNGASGGSGRISLINGELYSGGGGGGSGFNSYSGGLGGSGGGGRGDGSQGRAVAGTKHTGGGGGGGGYISGTGDTPGATGGSGIVLIKSPGIGKTIAKVKDIVIDPTNDSNVLISTQGTGISTVTYSVDSGSEVSTPVSQLSVAHGLAENVTGTLLAYALNASSARLGVKLSKSFTTPYGYETFTITQHVNASQTLSITDNGTDNITSVYKNSGSSAWDAGFYTPTFNAPITLEFNKTAPSTTSSSDVRIGITDTPTVNTTTMLDNMSYYFRSRQTSIYQITEKTGVGSVSLSAWDGSKKHYIVYKTNGGLEFWNGDDLKFSVANWGVGKSVRFETGHLDNNSTLNNTLTNIRMKRREWDGTKYIN